MRSAETRFENPLFFRVVCLHKEEEGLRKLLRRTPGISLASETHDVKLQYRTAEGETINEVFAVSVEGASFASSQGQITEILSQAKKEGFL